MLLMGTIRNAGRPAERGGVADQPQQTVQRSGWNHSDIVGQGRVLRLVLRTQPRSEAAPDSLPRTDNLGMHPRPNPELIGVVAVAHRRERRGRQIKASVCQP